MNRRTNVCLLVILLGNNYIISLPQSCCCRYQVTKDGIDVRTDRYGLVVQIDTEVEVTSVLFNIGEITLLTRVGGIIGVGKNLLWLIITLLTYTFILYNKVFKF